MSRRLLLGVVLAAYVASPVVAQESETTTRTSLIEQAQADKAAALQPYTPGAAEKYVNYAENYLKGESLHWHPFFDNAYAVVASPLAVNAALRHRQHPGHAGLHHVQGLHAGRGQFLAPGRCSVGD
jgi:hypothetical protein